SAFRHGKNEENTTSKKLGVSFARSRWEGEELSEGTKRKAQETVNTSAVNPKMSARQRPQVAGGSGGPKSAGDLHQAEGNEQRPLRSRRPDDTPGHVSTEQAPLRTTVEDLPEKISNPGQARAQPPLVNGQTSPTGSAKGDASTAGSEHNNTAEFDHDSESESKWHSRVLPEEVPSPNPDQQSPLEETGEVATARDSPDGGSQGESNAVSDLDKSTRSSVLDSESDMFINAHSPQGDGGLKTADLTGKQAHGDKYRNEWLDDPKPDAAQPDGPIQRKQDLTGTNKGAKAASWSTYHIKTHQAISRTISSMLRKAQSAGNSKFNHWRRKTSQTTPRSLSKKQGTAALNPNKAGHSRKDTSPGQEDPQPAHNQVFLQPQPPPLIQASDSRYPSSALFPQPVQYSLPFEGPPYENRNVRDRVNYALWPTYSPAQETQALHEMWQFRPYRSSQLDEVSWGHVTRHCLPLDESELQKLLVKSRKSKTSVARALARLTSYQQRQIGLLVTERCLYATAHRFQWTVQAVETFPKRSKPATSESMQVILERHLAPGAYLGLTESAAAYPGVFPGPGPYFPSEPTQVEPPLAPVPASAPAPSASMSGEPPPPLSSVSQIPTEPNGRPQGPGAVMRRTPYPAQYHYPASTLTPSYPAGEPRQIAYEQPVNTHSNLPLGYYGPTTQNGQYAPAPRPQMASTISNAHRSGDEASHWPSGAGPGLFTERYPPSKVLPTKPPKRRSSKDSIDDLISRWTIESVA
ncbi:MAG: hypothetical protein Q9184_007862, partial [Pyrenodesmia sp. 2 TL-2023]